MVRGALIILFNENKKILLQFRTANAIIYPRHWAFFGGTIEEGETKEETLKREALEELNYVSKNPVLAVKLDQVKGEEHYYYVEKYSGEELTLNEGEKMGWFTIEEAKKLNIAPNHQIWLDQIEEKINEQE